MNDDVLEKCLTCPYYGDTCDGMGIDWISSNKKTCPEDEIDEAEWRIDNV